MDAADSADAAEGAVRGSVDGAGDQAATDPGAADESEAAAAAEQAPPALRPRGKRGLTTTRR